MGNGITDEMRKWAFDFAFVSDNPKFAKRVTELCDNIDAAHEKSMSEQYASLTIDMQPMTDENMAKDGWIRLPMDADGEYIHIGDKVTEHEDGHTFKVDGFMDWDGEWWVFMRDGIQAPADRCTRYHEPTVEDILQEFRDEARVSRCTKETIDEFADRIREAARNEQQ